LPCGCAGSLLRYFQAVTGIGLIPGVVAVIQTFGQKISNQKYTDASGIAMVYVGLGEIDGAFKWLENAFEERTCSLINLKIEPRFDRIRSDQRYKALLKKMGLDK
jgi:hypothetical protein